MINIHPRDTYRYKLVDSEGKLLLFHCTNDPIRREAEHQERFQGSRLQIIGSKITRRVALRWVDG